MGEATRTASTDALSERAQQLLRDNRPAESAPILKDLIERLDTEQPGDLQARAEARRLLGSALRESGDLAGSTAALEDAIGILRSGADSSGQKLVLAIASRPRESSSRSPKTCSAPGRRTGRLRSLS